ncbi:psp1 domain-containing protein [Ophiostoma piceae UAMH 11346]|uniref:Psp1 domain-containing protein n=1 Tax=Ophiostoma piceae (strain UAMH 11346) TaxID=1262450 RepID=S3C393_OPHP1|nr:psp1 domain-containing protein [Ophiostoma piceae UAMH 11346]
MSATFKPGPPLKQGHSGLSAAAPGSQAILLDKFNRRSTPDSEALASSDDEVDLSGRFEAPATTTTAAAAAAATTPSAAPTPTPQGQPHKPVRRASWLNDTSQPSVRPRNDSFASSSMSPTASHPNTPSIDATTGSGIPTSAAASGTQNTWGAHATSPAAVLNRGPTAFHWGSTSSMWNTSDRKEHTSRRSDVLPSPTSAIPPGSSGGSFFGSDSFAAQTSPASRDGLASATSQIPFAIPLHPTPKTYRSQSYSVGQLEPDSPFTSPAAAAGLTSATGSASLIGSRTRPIAGLQHRPSRPSMLSEMSSDGGLLGKVREVEDDGDDEDEVSGNDSLPGSQRSQHSQHNQPNQHFQQTQQAQQSQQNLHLSAEAKTIEMLTRENALLRQQAVSQQYHNVRIRPRASTAAAYRLDNSYGLQDSVPTEVSDYAIDELDEINDGELAAIAGNQRVATRRMSEFAAVGSFRSPYSVENRKLENVKKASWQSSPAGGLSDISPSRRHSFADVPTRQASISSISEVVLAHDGSAQDAQSSAADFAFPYGDPHSFASRQAAAAAGQSLYANGAAQTSTQQLLQQQQQQHQQQQYGASAYPSAYGVHSPVFAARPTSPQRGMYGLSQPNRSTPLHIVLFKCARADVFYIQEGTGLTIKPGDLVIVEADRGTDLGTVAVEGVDWVEARRLKEHYAEEQYKWLMMYSQNAAAAQEGAGAGLMASASGLQGSAVGGMGPPGQHHAPEPSTSELKPKLIKRLAQTHEIQALRDKEGNEAKAKRVCMQKVKEHGLNMEILDAEFQMDWKKLTFYYFADAYINFNSLVTDLFKIYKTRIWMSAINPASFASQPLGLQAPSGIGPGAVGVGRGAPASERRQTQSSEPIQQIQQAQQIQQIQQMQPAYAAAPATHGGYPGGMGQQPPSGVGGGPTGAGNYPASFSYGPYSAFGNVPRASGLGYGQPGMSGNGGGIANASDAYGMGYGSPQNEYHMMRGRFANGNGQSDGAHNGHAQSQSISPLGPSPEWLANFQSLSMTR